MKTEDLINQFSNYLFGFELIKDKVIFSRLLDRKDLIPIFFGQIRLCCLSMEKLRRRKTRLD